MAVVDSLDIKIKNNVAATNKELDDMIAKLGGVAKAIGGIDLKKLSTGGMTGVTARLSTSLKTVAVSANTARTSFLHLGNASKTTNTLMSSLWNTLRRFVGIYAIFRGLKYAVQQYSDLVEVQNRVDVTFGNSKKVLEDWAATSRTAFGVSALSAKTIASTYQAMGTAMGYSQGEMADMSVSLTQLAADMASFYDKNVEDIATDLNAVFTGQTRPLRKYGLDLTQATLAEWALKNGLDANIKSMSQAEKTMLRYKYVMAQTAAAQGDFARTQYTFANQWRVLKQNLTAFAVNVGEVIAQALRPLLIWMNRVMERVITVSKTIVNALGKIFGWEMQVSGGATASDEVADLAENLGEAGTAADDASKGVDGVKKSVDKLKNTILGFDELNVLNDVDENTSSGGSGGSGGGSGSAGSPASDFADEVETSIVKAGEPIWEKYKSSINSLRELGKYISDALTDAMNNIDFFKIYDKAKNFGRGLAEFLNGLITPELFRALGRTIAGALNTALFAKNEYLKNFDFANLGKSIASGINGFFKRFRFDIAGENLALFINGIATSIYNAADDIEWSELGNRMGLGIERFVATISGTELGRAANELADGILNAIKGALERTSFEEIGDKIREFLLEIKWKKKFDGIGDIIAKAINGAIDIGIDVFSFDWGSVGKDLGESFTRFMGKIDGSELGNSISSGLLAMVNFINGFLSDGTNWYTVGNTIGAMLSGLRWREILYAAAEAFWRGLNAALMLAAGVFDDKRLAEKIKTVSETFDLTSLTDAITKLIDALEPATKGFMSGFIDGLTDLVGIGAGVIDAVADAVYKLAEAIEILVPADVLEQLGEGLGKIAAALVTIAGVNIAGSVIGKLATVLGLGTTVGGAATVGTKVGAGGGLLGFIGKGISEVKTALGYGSVGRKWLGFSAGASQALTEQAGRAVTTKSRGGSFDFITDMSTNFENAADDIEGASSKMTRAATASLAELGIQVQWGKKTVGETSESVVEALTSMEKGWVRAGGSPEVFAAMLTQSMAEAEASGRTFTDAQVSGIESYIKSMDKATETTRTSMGEVVTSFGAGGGSIRMNLRDIMDANDEASQSTMHYGTMTMDTMGNVSNHVTAASHVWETLSGRTKKSTTETTADTDSMTTSIGSNMNTLSNFLRNNGSAAFGEFSETSKKEMGSTETDVKQKNTGILDSFKTAWGGSYKSVALQLGLMNIIIAAELFAMKLVVGGYEKTMKATADKAIALPFKEAADSAVRYLRDLPGEAVNALSQFSERVRDAVSIDLSNEGRNAAYTFAQGIQSVYIPMPHITVSATAYANESGYGYSMNSYLNWYANGGFPDRGELFIANENGVPEMVGRIGGSPAVANNEQITEAIRDAVIEGMMNTSGDSSQPIEFTMRVDSETLYRTTLRGKKKYDIRFA